MEPLVVKIRGGVRTGRWWAWLSKGNTRGPVVVVELFSVLTVVVDIGTDTGDKIV